MTGAAAATSEVDHLRAKAPAPGTMAADLGPVVDALVDAARTRAQAVSVAADHDVAAELAQAHDAAERILGEARADGTRAAEQRAARQLAGARREAREVVLAARRAAYETLRRQAIEALERHGATPAGRQLGELLETMARARVGTQCTVSRSGRGALGVLATSDHRRAAIGPATLVDWALQARATQVESLWA